MLPRRELGFELGLLRLESGVFCLCGLARLAGLLEFRLELSELRFE